MKRTELVGANFGRWTVERAAESRRTDGGSVKAYWHCACSCGERQEVRAEHLRSGRSQSCGCLQREVAARLCFVHGQKDHPLYEVWCAIHQRCGNPRNKAFKNYGGRGITVCDRWRDFAAFAADMGERPAGKSIDRINNDDGYRPDNCRWATPKEQAQNSRPKRKREALELAA